MNYFTGLFLCVFIVVVESYGYRRTFMPMAKVDLNVFSGRPNPSVEVPLPLMMNMMKKFPLRPTKNNPRALGYRGFIVNMGTMSMPIPGGSSRELEGMMMKFFNIPMEVRDHCNQQIFGKDRNNPLYTEFTSSRTCQNPQSSTMFQPSRWNSNSMIQEQNNCYNYATDIITNTFAQPGRASGYNYPSTTGQNLQYSSELDGLVRVEPPSEQCLPVPNRNLVALVIWPGMDYHFYRLDSDGTFSHKPGQTIARNYDNSGETITDPRSADRGPYTTFHCFMETSSNSVRIM
ncbi:uncharacterized protein LOC133182216 [Saccostrea echinata]|uniref:uncharacterized protein LOC133182216 n=1 Tax=Saccostrea echinata TaxID=191078 RepID=UPI002A80AAC9|nr:uncharacterized protein LOC133182216 [Saccostrea echinata]